MQKLFSQKLRFKDENGNDFSVWKCRKLKDLVQINKGKQLNKSVMLEKGEFYVLNGGIKPSGYTNEWNTKENTITISEGGNSCGYVNFNKEKFWSGGHCYYINKLNNKIENLFLFQELKYHENSIMRLRVGSGLPNIQKGDIEFFKIKIPVLKEQMKIAKFLISIDDKIDKMKKELEKEKEFKKGLLQKMFC